MCSFLVELVSLYLAMMQYTTIQSCWCMEISILCVYNTFFVKAGDADDLLLLPEDTEKRPNCFSEERIY